MKNRKKNDRTQPVASRPHMPGYGIADEKGGKGLLPWTWATERLTSTRNYFIATTRPDGRPHVMPVWGIWRDDAFYFSTGRDSIKARNLVNNPKCVLCSEQSREAVIVEGVARELEKAVPKPVAAAYRAKYQWALDPELGPIFVLRPIVAFGFIEHGEDFAATATRWTFVDERETRTATRRKTASAASRRRAGNI